MYKRILTIVEETFIFLKKTTVIVLLNVIYFIQGTEIILFVLGFQRLDGVTGALIVRQSKAMDPAGDLYDYDEPEHYIFIQDWMHEVGVNNFPGRRYRDPTQFPHSYAINGRGRYTVSTYLYNAISNISYRIFIIYIVL